jgi:hypothetical protein
MNSVLEGHTDTVSGMAGSADKTIKLWDISR